MQDEEPGSEAGAQVVELEDERRIDAKELVAELNQDGFRVVAVAYRDFPTTHGPYTVADESDLILAGFIGFLDPPKESAEPALKALAQTRRVGQDPHRRQRSRDAEDLSRRRPRLRAHRVGNDLRGLDDAAVGAIAAEHTVFAKLTPDDKTRIVRSLKARGHTVGFLGDGINDAGALREADVGVSVDSAVDIAKESADIILLEKSLMVLEEGVIEGRRTFGNTIKYIKMTASSNFGNVFSVLVASAFLPFLPMLPVQLLTVNLLYDFSQASIPWDDMDPEYLRVPRQWRADDIGRFMVFVGPTSSIFDIATFVVMWYVVRRQHPGAPVAVSIGLVHRVAAHADADRAHDSHGEGAVHPESGHVAGACDDGRDHRGGAAAPLRTVGPKARPRAAARVVFPLARGILLSYAALTQLMKGWYIRKFGSWL